MVCVIENAFFFCCLNHQIDGKFLQGSWETIFKENKRNEKRFSSTYNQMMLQSTQVKIILSQKCISYPWAAKRFCLAASQSIEFGCFPSVSLLPPGAKLNTLLPSSAAKYLLLLTLKKDQQPKYGWYETHVPLPSSWRLSITIISREPSVILEVPDRDNLEIEENVAGEVSKMSKTKASHSNLPCNTAELTLGTQRLRRNRNQRPMHCCHCKE